MIKMSFSKLGCSRFIVCACIFLISYFTGYAQKKVISVSEIPTIGSFPLVSAGKSAVLVTDKNEAEVVGIAAVALAKDIQTVTGVESVINNNLSANSIPVIIGTLGKSQLIDQLAAKNLIPATQVKGKWETFCLTVVDLPFNNIKKALVIFGSDPRGTAYGVFELSKMMGVSPLVWWADVVPKHRPAIYVTPGNHIIGPPSVKYRGIFINDEDWGIQPWAAKNMDTDVKDIGPKTYQKVFELMLRIKANYLWPAMHPCTKAFWFYPGNPEMARKYDIVLGASHCEPLLRNNVFEWAENFKNEYGTNPGEWRYDLNKAQIDKYWDDRVIQSKNNDAVYTVGMRGIHDGSMPGPKSKEEKKKLLEQVITDQRELLTNGLKKPEADIPQIFCPYKEVLDLYRLGMKLPDDVTLAWADDNYGYVRTLSNPAEQKRSGGSGVYYHLSYWGAPLDFLWLSTISPALTSYELTKAYQLNAKNVWIFNVGDIKPAEMELQFAMDLAWDVKAWSPEKADQYPEYWAAGTFGPEFAKEIGHIKSVYYHLAAAGKPEQLTGINYTDDEIAKRIADYQGIVNESRVVGKRVPARLKDAYYELIAYPVESCLLMNQKMLYARQSLALAKAGDKGALVLAQKSLDAFAEIQRLTEKYNKEIAGGKWNGMMDYAPRGLAVFKKPIVANEDMIANASTPSPTAKTPIIIQAADYNNNAGLKDERLKLLNGLGIGKSALTVWPMDVNSIPDDKVTSAPVAEYQVSLNHGNYSITLRCLPTFPLYTSMQLRYAIAIDGGKPEFVNMALQAETKAWATNVLRGFNTGKTDLKSINNGTHSIKIYFPDPGIALSDIVIEQYDQ